MDLPPRMNLRVGDLLPRLNYRVVHPETHTVFHPRISFTHTLVHITQKNGASDTMALLAAGRKGHFGLFHPTRTGRLIHFMTVTVRRCHDTNLFMGNASVVAGFASFTCLTFD